MTMWVWVCFSISAKSLRFSFSKNAPIANGTCTRITARYAPLGTLLPSRAVWLAPTSVYPGCDLGHFVARTKLGGNLPMKDAIFGGLSPLSRNVKCDPFESVPICFQRIAHAIFHSALVLGVHHVDEIDYYQAADVSNSELAGDLVCSF